MPLAYSRGSSTVRCRKRSGR
ncbi:MAG TPA: hypothetical protein ENN05_02605 [Deltaproteobacteria bacterium]|nr:hypothetical protein [Deltaproteobacteria bacterium]